MNYTLSSKLCKSLMEEDMWEYPLHEQRVTVSECFSERITQMDSKSVKLVGLNHCSCKDFFGPFCLTYLQNDERFLWQFGDAVYGSCVTMLFVLLGSVIMEIRTLLIVF